MSSYDYFMSELEVLDATARLRFNELFESYKGVYGIDDFIAVLNLLQKSKTGELFRLVQEVQSIKWELGDLHQSVSDMYQVLLIILKSLKDKKQ